MANWIAKEECNSLVREGVVRIYEQNPRRRKCHVETIDAKGRGQSLSSASNTDGRSTTSGRIQRGTVFLYLLIFLSFTVRNSLSDYVCRCSKIRFSLPWSSPVSFPFSLSSTHISKISTTLGSISHPPSYPISCFR